MKKIAFIFLLVNTVSQVAWANANGAENTAVIALAKSHGCFSCHALDEKIVGPAYNKVAAKYSGDKDAVASLVQSIRNGSQGKWGRIPMPAHNNISNEDLNTLAQWVMTVKP